MKAGKLERPTHKWEVTSRFCRKVDARARLRCTEVMLLAIYIHEYFINEKGVAVASVLSLQPAGVDCTELDTEPAP